MHMEQMKKRYTEGKCTNIIKQSKKGLTMTILQKKT